MKFIKKAKSPPQFECWKKQSSPSNWNDLPGSLPQQMLPDVFYYSKNELRISLSHEQGKTCCYCEMQLTLDPSCCKIDHIIPQSHPKGKNLVFNYSNLGLSCNGGEKDTISPKILHCDSHKGNSLILITPYNKTCEKKFKFDLNGKIITSSDDVNKTVDILNLNIAKLNNWRRNAIAGYVFANSTDTQLISSDEASELLKNLKGRNDLPFKTAIIQALKLLSNENKSFLNKVLDFLSLKY